ncbi:hypothetical protein, partial [Acinetobacter baumannii]|uniref:hypothetical protein n=2 Tax=Pseudomonadota TaxID=1224 RepID=UPI001BB46C51
FTPPADRLDFIRHVGMLWLAIGIGGGLARVLQLFATRGVTTGLVWAFKVLTDPFHNIALYWNSPLKLMRGELIDSAIADADWGDDDAEEAAHSA